MAKNTITLTPGVEWIQKEAPADVAITPGELVETISTGKFQPHGSAGDPAMPMFAVENDLAGETIDEDYVIDDQVRARVFPPGAVVYAWLANGEDIAIGDRLMSDGLGALTSVGSISGSLDHTIAMANEAVDTSASGGTRLRIEVVVL